jgi:hypothetical protein
MAPRFDTIEQAMNAWREDRDHLARKGLILAGVTGYLPAHFKEDFAAAQMAMDAQPSLSSAANAGIPAFLTNWVDPEIVEIRFAPNKAALIFGEEKKGDWTTQTAFFPLIEHTGEVTTYGDYNENGSVGANVNWPQRQSYLYQTFKEYGELELDRMGLAKISWVAQQDTAAAIAMSKYENLSYFFGLTGLQLYGALNDPNLAASLTPAPKAYGGSKWVNNNVVVATANEIYTDIQSMYSAAVAQSNGLIDQETKGTLAMSPGSSVAMTQVNAFNVKVKDLIKENFPNLKIETAVQYGASGSSNNQGNPAGNLVQMIFESVEGQRTSRSAFSEKMRAHKIIQAASSWKQKVTGGTWGTVIKQPFAISSLLGV